MGALELIARAYRPTEAREALAVLVLLVATLVVGFLLQRFRSARVWPWGVLIGVLVEVERLTRDQPPGFRMLALCGASLLGMKGVVGCESRRAGEPALDVPRWFAFSVLWFGMRPRAFLGLGGPARPGVGELARRGARNAVAGAALVALAHVAAGRDQRWAAWLLGLPGISLLAHFGLFHLAAAFWRSRGADVGALFRDPPRSRSLSEFWGRRWNLAFSEMTSLAVHRPLRGPLGNGPAIAAAFLFSGLLHELAISAPVGAGFGLPMAYFALHGAAMLLERRLGLAGPWARVWTVAWVLVPLPLLFHGWFLAGVVDPLLGL